MASPLPGPAGNVEFLLWARAGVTSASVGDSSIEDAIEDGATIGVVR
jgi:hypothetical protein